MHRSSPGVYSPFGLGVFWRRMVHVGKFSQGKTGFPGLLVCGRVQLIAVEAVVKVVGIEDQNPLA